MSNATGQELAVAAQWDPKRNLIFRTTENVLGGIGAAGQSLTNVSERTARSVITQTKRYDKWLRENVRDVNDPTAGIFGTLTTGLDDLERGITTGLDSLVVDVRRNLQPVSDFMGSTLGTLTGVIRDPLGPNGLGNVATNLLNNVSPGLGDRVNGSLNNVGLQNLQNLPTQIFTSIDHLITAIDDILAVPINFLAEIYFGYMELMQKLTETLSNIFNKLIETIFSFLDAIIPINAIIDLLQAIGDLAGQIGGIASTFFNINEITQYTNFIQDASLQIQGVLNSPMNLIVSVLPPEVNQIINLLQSPEELINRFLPPELNNIFDKLPAIAGFGFNGNMGFGFQSVLEGVQGGVIRGILTQFSAQYSFLAPLIAGTGNNQPSGFPALLNNGYSSAYDDESLRGNKSPQYQGP